MDMLVGTTKAVLAATAKFRYRLSVATIQCPQKITCCESDFPILNYSSESPDLPVFIGRFPAPPDGPLSYASPGCLALCTSTISQEDADLCAQRQALECDYSNLPEPPSHSEPGDGTFVERATFFNTEQTATATCPDGSTHVEVVAAGTMVALTQVLADALALSVAQALASARLICFATDPPGACVGTAYSFTLDPYGGVPPYSFTLTAGAPPDGIAFDSIHGILFGSATNPGTFSVTIQVTDSAGNTQTKTFAMRAVQITTASPLPAGFTGVAYNQALAQSGGTAPVSWQITGGALPPGLTLNEASGAISGTPLSVGLFSFTVTLQDQAS
jgi:putative Ig domain-containing protein